MLLHQRCRVKVRRKVHSPPDSCLFEQGVSLRKSFCSLCVSAMQPESADSSAPAHHLYLCATERHGPCCSAFFAPCSARQHHHGMAAFVSPRMLNTPRVW